MTRYNSVDGPLPNIERRVCRRCSASKPKPDFGWQANRTDPTCLDCRSKINAERERTAQPRDAASVRRMNLWRLYRIRVDEYDTMLAAQGHRCAACGTHESDIEVPRSGRPRRDGTKATPFPLQVDHCHTTGRIRGLLCSTCNRAIGIAKDQPLLLEGCAAYLRSQR